MKQKTVCDVITVFTESHFHVYEQRTSNIAQDITLVVICLLYFHANETKPTFLQATKFSFSESFPFFSLHVLLCVSIWQQTFLIVTWQSLFHEKINQFHSI